MYASTFQGMRPATTSRCSRVPVRCQASNEDTSRRQLLGAGLMFAASWMAPMAKADIIADLKAKSEANKELNDKKRLAASYANLARTRTLNDGTCTFPRNFFGCDVPAVAGDVKYITDDIKLACENTRPGYCPERPNMLKLKE